MHRTIIVAAVVAASGLAGCGGGATLATWDGTPSPVTFAVTDQVTVDVVGSHTGDGPCRVPISLTSDSGSTDRLEAAPGIIPSALLTPGNWTITLDIPRFLASPAGLKGCDTHNMSFAVVSR